MTDETGAPAPSEDTAAAGQADAVDLRKRRLLKQMGRTAYATPVALAMMTMSANACSLTC